MEAQQLVASARNLVIVRPRRNVRRNAKKNATRIATRIYVTEKETRKGKRKKIKTGIATVIVTVNGNARETGTKTMIVTVIAIATATATEKEKETKIGSERETETATVIVKRTETVVPGTTVGMTTTHDGHPVTTVAIANVIGIVTHREIVGTESVIVIRHEDQVRDERIENDAVGGTKKTEVAMTSLARDERLRPMSEVRRYAVYCIQFS
jgi:hypothetical protein